MAVTFERPGGTTAGGGGGGGTAFEPIWKQVHDGDITNVTPVEIRGWNSAFSTTEEGFSMNNARENFLASAEQLQIVSLNTNDTSAGTGARTVRVTGLDTNYAEITEDITMNGTTDVQTTNSYLRVNELKVLTVGSNGSNHSLILAENNASSTRIHAIYTGYNLSGAGTYTVPAGKTFYLMSINVLTDGAAASGADFFIHEHDSVLGGVDRVRFVSRSVDTGASTHINIDLQDCPMKFTEKTDIEFTMKVVSGAIGGGILARGFLVDDPA